MKPYRRTKKIQIRWGEWLGDKSCPYARRWVFIFFGYSIRIHQWWKSDDSRFMHDHSWDFRTFVLKGYYYDVSENDNGEVIRELVNKTAFRKATHKHYVEIPKEGAWTLLFCSRPYRNWGFWDKGKFRRPLRFFSRYGHPPCSDQ